eukprot:m.158820 g.158820  ORF g.158820 m.158820 type:complete len:292 (-) comp23700_c0_seq1:223-1098(-)
MERSTRQATHAGSWYSADDEILAGQLDGWMDDVDVDPEIGVPIAVIAPHAGYSYSGPSAAFAYRYVKPEGITRVFLLGPSHKYYLRKCALSTFSRYATPLGAVDVDVGYIDKLAASGLFETIPEDKEVSEHSLEMHVPYIQRVMRGQPFKLVPMLVGSLELAEEQQVAELLIPYLDDPQNLFIVSSDFCHWGQRFDFVHHKKTDGPIWKSIEQLDRQGMGLIEAIDADGFKAYLDKTQNTICGRNPISLLLRTLKTKSAIPRSIKFTTYAQSSQCVSVGDSSVSYASAIIA